MESGSAGRSAGSGTGEEAPDSLPGVGGANEVAEDTPATPEAADPLFNEARFLPSYEEGQLVGIRVDSIQRGSLFEDMGLRDGDTITVLNGVQVTNATAAAALRQFTQATRFEISVIDDAGETHQIVYELQ